MANERVLSDIISIVEEKCDGRSLGASKHKRWADLVRKEAVTTAVAAGFHGLYFLYKEATVIGGSVANQARYELPDDFIDDLSVWYDGISLIKAPPGVLDITAQADISGGYQPTWYNFRGLELEILPKPPVSGKEIKFLYNGQPEAIVEGTDPATFTDYFLQNWGQLHVFGMAEFALDSVGAYNAAKGFRARYNEEVARMAMKLSLIHI